MMVLLCDVETTGVSWDEGARVIEVAAALYDTKHAAVIESYASLIRHESNEAEKINRIPAELLREHGNEPDQVWDRFLRLAKDAECFAAHNAAFDQLFVAKSIDALAFSQGGEPSLPRGEGPPILDWWDPEKPWCCTLSDLVWPYDLRGTLTSIALGLGLGVASAHRALTDVDTMARCLTRAQEIMLSDCFGGGSSAELPENADFLEPLFRRAMRPKTRVVALVSYEARQSAKDAGFLWDDKRREWFRLMPPEDIAGLPFRAVERS
jgi:DNA polymerase III epsilon subunit-like protein